jgi:lysyl endopeptidase
MSKVARIVVMALLVAVLAGPLAPAGAVAQQPPQPAPLDQVPVVTMPAVDVEALMAEDVVRYEQGLPPRFAQPIPVQITPAGYGIWETQTDGTRLWRLRISSPGAVSLNLGFTRYQMPLGGRLVLYTPDQQVVRGPFTAADNEAHGQLWSPILPGDEIVIEVSLPAAMEGQLELMLTAVNHGYREFGRPYSPESGACNLDVVCSAADGYPQVDAWRHEIRSVAVISTGGSTFCTGFLVNNTAEDLKGYFMTANHCGISSGNAASLVTYWNYENSWCRPVGSPASGGPGDGLLNQYNTGSIFRASYSASDFTLVELDDPINPDYDVHWAGWDATSADATNAVGIHHPNTDEKRISFENDPTTTTSYLQTSVPGDGTHVRITDWDLGTTEPGSSGSPLFNQNYHVIGQLHGGYAACGNDDSDWYGRFSVSWDRGGSTPTNRLRDWLDPGNTGQLVQDGRDRIEAPFTLAVTPEELSVCAPDDGVYSVTVGVATPGFADPVDLVVSGNPAGTIAQFGANPVVPTDTTTLVVGNTGAAAEGQYYLDVSGQSGTDAVTETVGLNLFAGLPVPPALTQPADGAVDQSFTPTFEWSPGSLTGSYSWELDYSPFFTAPLEVATGLEVPTYSLTDPLDGGRCYWWRVQGENACGLGMWTEPFHFATASLAELFSDDVEAGGGNWTHQAAQGIDHWAISTAQAHSPTHSWFVPDDNVVTDSRLWVTNPIVLGNAAGLTFWHRYQFEGGSYDGSVLEISTDGGGSWADLGSYITANGYNGTISTGWSNPLAGQPAWTGDLTTWTQVAVDLSTFAGQSVEVRWRLGCDSSASDVGWYIDDVQILAALPPNPAPTVDSIVPDWGLVGQDTPVTVYGSGFITTPVLALGDTWLPDVVQVSPTTLTAVVPAGMAAGVYDLALYNGDCQEAVLTEAFTVVGGCVSPDATVDSDSPVDWGQPMHFAATVTGTAPMTYNWSFGGAGDGSGLDTATPVFTYTMPGNYTVTLTVANGCGQDVVNTGVAVVVAHRVYLPLVIREQ